MAEKYYVPIITVDRFRSALSTLSGKTLAQLSLEMGRNETYINCAISRGKMLISSVKQLAFILGITEEKLVGYMRDEPEPVKEEGDAPGLAEEARQIHERMVQIAGLLQAILTEVRGPGAE